MLRTDERYGGRDESKQEKVTECGGSLEFNLTRGLSSQHSFDNKKTDS